MTAPCWRGEPGFFEIWFLVVFDRAAARAWWLRWTTFAPRAGAARGTVWAAAFDANGRTRWGKRFVPVEEVHAAAAALAEGRAAGRLETAGGPLVWDLALDGGADPVRGPGWLHRVPAPTRVAHLRGEAEAAGSVRLGDGPAIGVRGVAAAKHIWGTRRVERLYWVYCPLLAGGGAFEATSVRVRRDRGPTVTPVWLRAAGRERRWWSVPGLFRHAVTPDGPGRLRVRAVSATARIDAVAACDPASLAGWVYRDPAGWDVHVAQSDVAACEVDLRTRAHPLAAWGAPRRYRGERAAMELHQPDPLPDVRYVGWDAST
jgi:hypothetical protein